MSITQCPECGGALSSTVTTCIHCGCRIATCEKCQTRFVENAGKCPACGNEIKVHPTTNSTPASAKKELFNLSSEPLDKAITDWKKTYNPDSTFLGFASSFSLVMTVFSCIIVLICRLVDNPVNQLILYPVFVFALVSLAVACPLSILSIMLNFFKAQVTRRNFANFCGINNISFHDLIQPTIYNLSKNSAPLNIKMVDRESHSKFTIAVAAWGYPLQTFANRLMYGLFEVARSIGLWCLLLLFCSFDFIGNPLTYISSFYFSMSTPAYIAIYCAIIIPPLFISIRSNNDKKHIKKRIVEEFPDSKDFKGKYKTISVFLP